MTDTVPSYVRIDRCPWPSCQVSAPYLVSMKLNNKNRHLIPYGPPDHADEYDVFDILMCNACKQLIMVQSHADSYGRGYQTIQKVTFPLIHSELSIDIPEEVRDHLQDARDSLSIPNLSVIASSNAIDMMLQYKNYEDKGTRNTNLMKRIEKAAEQHVITRDMAEWAQQVRLVANDGRHSKKGKDRPSELDANQCLEFATILAELLFVLPARVSRGKAKSQQPTTDSENDSRDES